MQETSQNPVVPRPPVTVVTFGVWDLLHVGHVRFLERARKLGDRLVVYAQDDDIVAEDKGHSPIIPLVHRLELLSMLRCVDLALPQWHLEFDYFLAQSAADVLVIGEDWRNEGRHRRALEWIERHGTTDVRMPRCSPVSTSSIIDAIRAD